MAYDVWLNGVGWGNGTTELMVWTENFNQRPLGSVRATPTFGGMTYDAWHYNSGGANVISLVARSTMLSGSLDLKEMFDWAIARGLHATQPDGQPDRLRRRDLLDQQHEAEVHVHRLLHHHGLMHADEVDIDAALVGRLIAAQFPHWADLPVVKVHSAGTDHAMYRLGADMVVRLPRLPRAARQVDKEQRWLPRLAPHLALQVPVPLGRGVPGHGFPMPWSVYAWLGGRDAFGEPIAELREAAVALGGFVAALRRIDATGAPPSSRGGPVRVRDGETRAAIRDLGAGGTIDGDAATAAWEQVLALPQWDGRAGWLHGDLTPSNLLTRHGRLTAVIDFGELGTGDPACDLIPAWNLFDGQTREVFRAAAQVDDATWARGRGWALCLGLGAEHYYRVKNPPLAAIGRRMMFEALADYRGHPVRPRQHLASTG